MEEIWKPIKGFENVYEVSNLGNVKRLATIVTMKNQVKSWEQYLPEYIFKPSLDGRGYFQVSLSIGEQKRVARVHRLVAEAFLPEPSEDLLEACKSSGVNYVLVNHKDNNTTNNKVSNLEWCNPKFNCDWCVLSGTHNTTTTKGSLNYNAELTEQDVNEILDLLKNKVMSQERIAQHYGVKQITISNIWTGRSWAWYTGIPRKERSKGKRRQPISMVES